jgi:hypothetical protein
MTNIVTDLLKALLGNCRQTCSREDKFLVNNSLLGNDSVNTSRGNEYATIKAVFSVRGPCREDGSNTSTVTLRIVGGYEKGSLESETVKYGHESFGTRTRK